jgi:peptide/nickel transport system permease protein
MAGRTRNALAILPLVLLAGASWVSILASHREPARFHVERAWAPPSAVHPLGCADGGLDIATYVTFAVGYVTVLAITVATVSAITGTLLGSSTALAGVRAQRFLLRTCDLIQAFPNFLLALAVLSAVQKPERWHIALVLLLTSWAGFARIAVVMSRKLTAADFVLAARSYGSSGWAILVRHAVPHVLGPILVQMGTVAAGVVLSESALAFVGFGPADGVSLGSLIEQGSASMMSAPHVLAVAVIAIAATSGSFQLAAEGIRSWVQWDQALR